MLDGRLLDCGVTGRTLTEWCGEVPRWRVDLDMDVDTDPFELVDEALEWVCWWWWIDRIEDTEDDVDLRPRSPADERRMAVLGVSGEGERECRL